MRWNLDFPSQIDTKMEHDRGVCLTTRNSANSFNSTELTPILEIGAIYYRPASLSKHDPDCKLHAADPHSTVEGFF